MAKPDDESQRTGPSDFVLCRDRHCPRRGRHSRPCDAIHGHPWNSLSRGEGSFSFEFQGRCSAFTSWRARERDPKTFSLAAHNQELVLRHMTFVLKQHFQISLECGLCFNHRIERLLHLGRQIICIDVLPLQFFPCHCLPPAWSDGKGKLSRGGKAPRFGISVASFPW